MMPQFVPVLRSWLSSCQSSLHLSLLSRPFPSRPLQVQVGGVDGTTMLAGATPGAPYLPAIYTPSNGYVG